MELRRQNDLFDQLSGTTQPDQESRRKQNSAGQADPISDSPRSGVVEGSSRRAREDESKSNLHHVEPPDVSAKKSSQDVATNIQDANQENSLSSPDTSDRSEKTDSPSKAVLDVSPASKEPKSASTAQSPADVTEGSNSGSSPIGSDQLTRFVSSRVPKNKRVLCLIVRDKVSRLNKAKSYFYPTYYLFLQAIVDIDSNTTELHTVGQSPTEIRDPTSSGSDAKASFSASSSISADMLFLGSTRGVNGGSSSATQLQSHSKSIINSFSDTEGALEDDLDVEPTQSEPKKAFKSAVNSDDQLKGQALIHPGDRQMSRISAKGLNGSYCDAQRSVASGLTSSDRSGGSRVREMRSSSSIDIYSNDEETDNENGINDQKATKPEIELDLGINAKRDGKATELNLFDNDSNPYTGAVGVLLAGRRRKKAKT